MRFLFPYCYCSLVVGLISATREALGFVAPSHRTTIATTPSSSSSFTRHEPSTSSFAANVCYTSSSSTPTRTRTTTRLYGWGPDPIWSTAFVESNIQACPSGSCVSLKVNVDDGSEFIYPGQYVQVKPVGGT